MKRDDVGPTIQRWLRETDAAPDDVQGRVARISREVRSVSQRGGRLRRLIRRGGLGSTETPPMVPPVAQRPADPPLTIPGAVSGRPGWLGLRGWAAGLTVVLVLMMVVTISRPAESPGGIAAGPTPDDPPVGLVAIGHNGLLGVDADPSRAQGHPQIENSWATGTAPGLDSIYQRLVAVIPRTEDHVSNQAGLVFAQSSSLRGEAIGALKQVPNPALVIIQTIDNDIRCDGTDPEHIPVFGQAVAKALDTIVASSPDTRILMVGARPVQPWVDFLRSHPDLRVSLPQGHSRTDPYVGTGMCDVFDPDGQYVPEHAKTLAEIYAAYEAEQERVCAAVPQCYDDDDIDDQYVYSVEDWSNWQYRSSQGNSEMAERYWPLVRRILGLEEQ